MLFRSVLLLAVAAVAVDAAATCESITIKGSGLCTNDITEMVCVPDGQTAAAYKTVMETGAALMDQSFCELAQSGCVGTLSKNADYCKTNGGMCTYMHVGMKVNNICSTAADCGAFGSLKTPKKVCCSTARNSYEAICTGYDAAGLDALVDAEKALGTCDDSSSCISGAASLSVSTALPAILAAFAMLFARF
mmetsp:Transcript_26460/g.61310  ORF Transcript_26460/g.61310 Transcript_26460/m.61310 type:complete len:192 (+) Transcript_26460:56-631(+)